jgi:hypothetical protein
MTDDLFLCEACIIHAKHTFWRVVVGHSGRCHGIEPCLRNLTTDRIMSIARYSPVLDIESI